ncbi:MAG: DNA-protecting protein DprA [Jiangellaceae bacterium]|nr:DNA-protecting protein DprA [Jiangellaceae bacterium]
MTSAAVSADRAARAALSALVDPGTPAGVRLARQVLNEDASDVLSAIRSGLSTLDRDGRLRRRSGGVDGETLLRHGALVNARFLCPGDAEWPADVAALELTDDSGARPGPPPLGLWVRGDPDLAAVTDRSVAVVGARAATEYGVRVAVDLAAEFAAAGWSVLSGAAYGVDAAAHRGALAAGGMTVAVLACGVDQFYPSANTTLLQRVAAEGLVVSELPPGSHPTRQRFLARNRLIAAMTRGTVVVEAATRSGALNTANWAGDIGRPVAAVPGPVTSSMSAGCHELVRTGAAMLVSSAAEVVDLVGDLGTDAAADPVRETRPWDQLGPDAREVMEAMPARRIVTVDSICLDTGMSAARCLGALAELSLAGMVLSCPDGWRLAPGVTTARGGA